MTPDRAASIRARLLNQAKARGEDYNLVLTRYAIERFLYRLSLSSARDRLWLKGALLFDLWFGVPHRPTRDADFLGFGEVNAKLLATAIREVCSVAAHDGMTFDPDSIATERPRNRAACARATRERHRPGATGHLARHGAPPGALLRHERAVLAEPAVGLRPQDCHRSEWEARHAGSAASRRLRAAQESSLVRGVDGCQALASTTRIEPASPRSRY